MGTALIQEYRFNEYCKRLQNTLCKEFDREFKIFLKHRGINIDSSLFEIMFNEPQNFASYRQTDMDQTRISNFSSIEGLPYISKKYALKRFMGMSESEIQENTELWIQENPDKAPDKQWNDPVGSDIRNIGITPGGIKADLGASELPDDIGIEGDFGGEDISLDAPEGDIGGAEGGIPPPDAGPGDIPG